MNRSMEGHALLQSYDYPNLQSYGTNGHVKLPGPTIDKPVVYEFGTSYAKMAEDLRSSPDVD